jgi:hypothetical protein
MHQNLSLARTEDILVSSYPILHYLLMSTTTTTTTHAQPKPEVYHATSPTQVQVLLKTALPRSNLLTSYPSRSSVRNTAACSKKQQRRHGLERTDLRHLTITTTTTITISHHIQLTITLPTQYPRPSFKYQSQRATLTQSGPLKTPKVHTDRNPPFPLTFTNKISAQAPSSNPSGAGCRPN